MPQIDTRRPAPYVILRVLWFRYRVPLKRRPWSALCIGIPTRWLRGSPVFVLGVQGEEPPFNPLDW